MQPTSSKQSPDPSGMDSGDLMAELQSVLGHDEAVKQVRTAADLLEKLALMDFGDAAWDWGWIVIQLDWLLDAVGALPSEAGFRRTEAQE